MFRIQRAVLCAALALCLASGVAAANTLVSRQPVRIVVPYAAGGSTDVIARLVAKALTDELGQTFFVENKPGAGGAIAHDMVSKAPADGTTLLFSAAGPLTVTPHTQSRVNYRPLDDFAPIKLIATSPLVLIVNPKVPAKSVQELIALARKDPGKMNYGSFGYGSAAHLTGELFKLRNKLEIMHVPFKGSSPALTGLIGGEVDLMFDVLVTALPHIQAGTLRALAVTSAHRSSLAPDLPTMTEAGVANFEAGTWFGLLARSGTSQDIIDRLSAALDKSLANPEFRSGLTTQGAEVAGGSPAQFNSFFRAEFDKWGTVVKQAGIKAD